jgi:ribose 5-phosphate isomerase B
MIYVGSDHRGFKLKEKVLRWIYDLRKYDFEDLGALVYDEKDDYNKYAELVASLVADNNNSLGILICGSGVGVEVVANKFDGIRASVGKNPKQVEAGRSDDDMNVLVIAADFTKDSEAKQMVKTFLETKFSGKSRHKRRISEIAKLEANN